MKQKIALIGYGYWGKKIYATLTGSFDYQVVVVEEKPITDKNISVSSFEDILADSKITHCCIATPENTHFRIAQRCLQNGKHVLVEKPLCETMKQAKELAQLARSQNLKLFVDYIFLYDQAFQEIKKILGKNELGRIQNVASLRFSSNIVKPNLTVFHDLAIHDIYLLRSLFGIEEYKNLEVKTRTQFKRGDHGSLSFSSPQFTFSAEYRWTSPAPKRSLILELEKGKIIWEKDGKTELLTIQSFSEKHKPQQEIIRVENTTSPLQKILENFLDHSTLHNSEQLENSISDTAFLETILTFNETPTRSKKQTKQSILMST